MKDFLANLVRQGAGLLQHTAPRRAMTRAVLDTWREAQESPAEAASALLMLDHSAGPPEEADSHRSVDPAVLPVESFATSRSGPLSDHSSLFPPEQGSNAGVSQPPGPGDMHPVAGTDSPAGQAIRARLAQSTPQWLAQPAVETAVPAPRGDVLSIASAKEAFSLSEASHPHQTSLLDVVPTRRESDAMRPSGGVMTHNTSSAPRQQEPRRVTPSDDVLVAHSNATARTPAAADAQADSVRVPVVQALLQPRQTWGDGALPDHLDVGQAPSAPGADTSRVQVRIGRVEVRTHYPPAPPAPTPPQRPRGFERHALARRYLDRTWY